MLASRINGLLPDLSNEEALESAAILSLVNAESVQKQWRQRPFRSPHHSASLTAMVGGGAIPGPGEISLAHNGVLFLDELPQSNGVHWMLCESRLNPADPSFTHTSKNNLSSRFSAWLPGRMNPSLTGHYQGNHNRYAQNRASRLTQLALGALSRPLRSLHWRSHYHPPAF
ncbi:ATP-binding protein [Escherichia coli]